MTLDDGGRWIGRRLGAYEILALIGSGGMGEVYRARRVDAEYEKEVAIKLLPFGRTERFDLERLRAERQILAKLDHPHIARLIEGGVTEEGLPYLIMELVEGEPIDRYCEQHKLPVRQRLRLFSDLCSAVSHAHQHLVVHRDLKPHNILVTADGKVKLLDFGIAKPLHPDSAQVGAAPTVFGVTPLTLAFASPEQVLGRSLTTVSDVYSLGVLLYLLLAGRMPYRNEFQSAHEAMREICETQPSRPSAVVATSEGAALARLDRDLDAITLRALRKEPGERYRSVEELSQDISRYLGGMPVIARGDEFSYRAGKFARRHTAGIAAAALIVCVLIGGIVSWSRQAQRAALETARAERHVATVREFADAAMFRLHDAIKDLPGSTAARELLVSSALQYLSALRQEADADPSLRLELAMAYMKVADIQGKVNKANTGNSAAAMDSYAKAIALLEPIVAADRGNSSARDALAQSYLQQSRLLVWAGEPKKAVVLSGKAIGVLESLAATNPAQSARVALADSSRVHAVNLAMNGSVDAAKRSADRSVEIMERLHREQEKDMELQLALGTAYGTAADVYQTDSRPAALERSNELRLKALAVDEHLVAITEGRNATYNRALLSDRVNLCGQHNDAGDYLRAIEFCRAAEPLLEKLRTDESNAQIELDAAALRLSLGGALLGAERLSEAAAVFDENVRSLRTIAERSNSLQVEYLLAASEQAMGHIEERKIARAQLSRAELSRRWRRVKEWYEGAVPRFEHVASTLSLTESDMIPVKNATAGLARSKEQIARLEGKH
jgi:eukaryotic-like serine/threonine-protein kinase